MRKDEKVFVYTKEGKLKRTIIVKKGIGAVTVNYATSNLEVMEYEESSFGTRRSFCIRTYSENDEVECLYLPTNEEYWSKHYCSHPTGPAALVYSNKMYERKIIFL
jgi:adenine C2-methylase RlmN of 23S rRNA A2503 and tRNA A37